MTVAIKHFSARTLSGRAQAGFAMPLFLKIFLAITVVVALALLAAILVTAQQGKRAAEAQIERDLKQVESAQKAILGTAREIVEIQTRTISEDPDFASYFAAANADDLGLDTGASSAQTDSAAVQGQTSIQDLLAERVSALNQSDADSPTLEKKLVLGLVLDTQGAVIARFPQEGEAVQESFADDAFISTILNDEDAQPISGFWGDRQKLYVAAISPIVAGDSVVGYFLLGNGLNKRTADDIGAISSAQVAIYAQNKSELKLLGTSLNAQSASSLESEISSHSTQMLQMKSDARMDLAIDGKNYSGALKTLSGEGGKPLGAILGLTPTDASKASFLAIQRAVNLTGIAALLAALLASWFLTRALLKPIRTLADAADKAADGDYSQQIDVKGADEIGKLGHAFDSLLSSLREKGDMEGYVSSLSKFLPEPGSQSVGMVRSAPHIAAQRYAMSLLGLDFRRFAQEVAIGQEAIAMTQLATLHGDALAIAATYGGKVLEHHGSRVLLGFGGDERHVRALHALAALLPRAASLGPGAAPAAALHDGELIHGSLPNFEPQSATIGLGSAQLNRLLGEAGPGQILLGPTLAKRLNAILGRDPGVATGATSGKRFYALTPTDLADLPRLPEPERDPNSTQIAGNETRVANGPVNESNAQRLAPGMRLGGRYEIQSVLGAGGMGVVYKAHDLELDDVVALKMLRGAALMDGEHLERLKSELKLARKITHPSVLRTHDFGDVNGQPFISMEYVRGMTLRYLIEQSGKLPFSAGLRIAKQIAGGLNAAHETGVLHRDIKPENVILEASGNAKLMDFGIARPIRRTAPGHTQPGMFIGTPTYSPPEALAGDEVDARSDIYSMGVMLCEMFCGQLPYKAGSTMELYVAHSQQMPIAPSVLWPEIPKALEAIILKCLEKPPSQRFASAQALLDALSELRS
jgi:eukaryotic-like serine/threonine-protein kinase